MGTPITLAVINDHEVVVKGVAAMLEPFAEQVRVLELVSDMPVGQPVDLALYDAFAHTALIDPRLPSIVNNPHIGTLVVYTWTLTEELMELAREVGVQSALAKSLSAEELVDALVAIHHDGGTVSSIDHDPERSRGTWPGRAEGLTAREAEIVALVTCGLSNQEIAQRTYLSINSVKSYIRTAYRTMGVTTRSQAVLWGVDHGMRPRPARILDSAG